MPYIDGLPPASTANGADVIALDQGGTPGVPGTATTRQASLAQIAAGVYQGAMVNLTAAGNSQGTAFQLTPGLSVFTTVASGTGGAIPAGAAVRSIYEVWNAGANNLSIYPPTGGVINSFATNAAAIILPGGSATFVLCSTTQVYAR